VCSTLKVNCDFKKSTYQTLEQVSMKYSFQLYSARNFTPWDQVFKSIADLGYSQVEGFGAVYENPTETRASLNAHNLSMPSCHFSLDDLENDLATVLETANTLGCEYIYCPYLDESMRPSNNNGWESIGKRLNELGRRITDTGKRFGWHNHDFEFLPCSDGSVPMRSILTSAPDIDWEMDVAWVARAATDPAPWITEFGSRISAVHVKDIAEQGTCEDEGGWADVGFGTLNWQTLLTQIKKETNAQLFIAEHDNPSDHERFARQSIESMKNFAL